MGTSASAAPPPPAQQKKKWFGMGGKKGKTDSVDTASIPTDTASPAPVVATSGSDGDVVQPVDPATSASAAPPPPTQQKKKWFGMGGQKDKSDNAQIDSTQPPVATEDTSSAAAVTSPSTEVQASQSSIANTEYSVPPSKVDETAEDEVQPVAKTQQLDCGCV